MTSEELKKVRKKLGYKGCRNCKLCPKGQKQCEWGQNGGDGHLHFICPRWYKNDEQEGEVR